MALDDLFEGLPDLGKRWRNSTAVIPNPITTTAIRAFSFPMRRAKPAPIQPPAIAPVIMRRASIRMPAPAPK